MIIINLAKNHPKILKSIKLTIRVIFAPILIIRSFVNQKSNQQITIPLSIECNPILSKHNTHFSINSITKTYITKRKAAIIISFSIAENRTCFSYFSMLNECTHVKCEWIDSFKAFSIHFLYHSFFQNPQFQLISILNWTIYISAVSFLPTILHLWTLNIEHGIYGSFFFTDFLYFIFIFFFFWFCFCQFQSVQFEISFECNKIENHHNQESGTLKAIYLCYTPLTVVSWVFHLISAIRVLIFSVGYLFDYQIKSLITKKL